MSPAVASENARVALPLTVASSLDGALAQHTAAADDRAFVDQAVPALRLVVVTSLLVM
jgi:hypothetical protein